LRWRVKIPFGRPGCATLPGVGGDTELEKFPDLDVIQTYNPQLGEGDLLPRIVGGDTEYAKRWLNGSCGGF